MATESARVLECTAEALTECLSQALTPDELQVTDESAAHAGHAGSNGKGSGTHFRVRIGSPSFAGKTRVAAHRLVYDSVQKFMDAGLHALAIEIVPGKPSSSQLT